MTENSRFWNTSNIGDGPTAGYARTAIAAWMRTIFGGGILPRVLNELAVSGSSSPLSVASGGALVDGLIYHNTAALNVTVSTPVGGTTGGRIVLRADWSAQTVRAVAKLNTGGNSSPPALTQTSETTYEISLCTFTITTGGVIGNLVLETGRAAFSSSFRANHIRNLTARSLIGRSGATNGAGQVITASSDEQILRRSGTALGFGQIATAGIADNAVAGAKLRDSAALSVIGRAANSSGDPADIAASLDGGILMRSGTALTFGQAGAAGIADGAISTAKLANDAIDDTKAGNRAPQLRYKQTLNGTVWTLPGTVNTLIGAVSALCGSSPYVIPANQTTGDSQVWVPYPTTVVRNGTLVLAAVYCDTNEFVTVRAHPSAADGFYFRVERLTAQATSLTVDVFWLAFGDAY